MQIKNLPEKFNQLWKICEPILVEGRPGDDAHAVEVAEFVLANAAPRNLDLEVFIPVAIMHDIGHSAILPEHFKFVTGGEKVTNGKLVHMLVGAKIAKDILASIDYDPGKSAEIVEMISVHDADQLEKADLGKYYDTENKKIFHDIDCMDRYNAERMEKMKKMFSDPSKIAPMLEKMLDGFFYPEFRAIAEKKMDEIRGKL